MAPYALIGGSYALGYQLIYEFMRGGHEGNNDSPKYIAHVTATTILGTAAGFLFGGLPTYAATGAVVAFFNVAPMTWWIYKHGKLNATGRPSNIFYQNDVSKEEVERI
jgi:hypothetical protein